MVGLGCLFAWWILLANRRRAQHREMRERVERLMQQPASCGQDRQATAENTMATTVQDLDAGIAGVRRDLEAHSHRLFADGLQMAEQASTGYLDNVLFRIRAARVKENFALTADTLQEFARAVEGMMAVCDSRIRLADQGALAQEKQLLEKDRVSLERLRMAADAAEQRARIAAAEQRLREIQNPEPPPVKDSLEDHRRQEELKTAKHEITTAQQQQRRQVERKAREEELRLDEEACQRKRQQLYPQDYETRGGWYKRLEADLKEDVALQLKEQYEAFEAEQEEMGRQPRGWNRAAR